MINQYLPEQNQPENIGYNKNKIWTIIVISIILISIITIIIFISRRTPSKICGDGICDEDETKSNCCIDCGCPSGYECRDNVCVTTTTILPTTSTIFQPSECGNNICDEGENCYNCPKDCKCEIGEYCSEEEEKCVLPECGNGICESFESLENCCDDCPCVSPSEFCNETTHKCEIKKLDITDDRIEELIDQYIEEKNETIISMDFMGIFVWEDETGMEVRVYVEEQDWPYMLFVTEDEEVIELPTT